MVRALSRKLVRDLVAQTGQVLTITLVIACGVAGYVSMRGCWKSLERSRDDYYAEYRFGDVFAHLEGAPDEVGHRLAEIPGVAFVETRLFEPIRVPLGPGEDPPRGWAISLPDDARPRLDAIWVRAGRAFDPERTDEAVLLASFARARGIEPGDALPVILDGRLRDLRVVGLAESPEFCYPAAPGEFMADASRIAVVWMAHRALQPMVHASGAFDDVVLKLEPGTEPESVVHAVDRLLAPYGGSGAIRREDQLSHKFLESEIAEVRMLSTTIPTAVLAIAAFLLQIVLARMVELQRTQIATLKAFGHTRYEIARHYLGLVLAIGVGGAGLGLLLGRWLGGLTLDLYAPFFFLPKFAFTVDPELVVVSIAVSLLAALAGALGTVLRVAAMPPAEAMQPAAPPSYRPGLAERLGLFAPLGPVGRMTARDLMRRPARLVFSVLGIAFATGAIVLGRFAGDSIGEFVDGVFVHLMAEDIAVALVKPMSEAEVRSGLGSIAQVSHVETQRTVWSRFSAGHLRRDGPLIGHPPAPQLRRLLTWPSTQSLPIPEHGIVLTDVLAERLDLRAGDWVDVEMMYRAHPRAALRIEAVVAEPMGLSGHVSLQTLGRLLGEQGLVTDGFLTVNEGTEREVVAALADIPGVLGATSKRTARDQFESQTAEVRSFFVLIATLFGSTLAVGIVYNNARVALSSRARELASLRVLGFDRAEVSRLVLGELTVHVVLGIPLGFVVGRILAVALMSTMSTDMWRFAVVVSPRTYAFAAAIVLLSSAASALVVRRGVAGLDLVAVLKTRE